MPALPAEDYLQTLSELCNLPTAPYCEQHVIAYLLAWAAAPQRSKYLQVKRDPVGNVYLHYRHGATKSPPLIVEAHMDHPGFVATGLLPDGRLTAHFRGGVRPSFFQGSTAAFWINEPLAVGSIAPFAARGHWVPINILEAKPTQSEPKNYIEVVLEPPSESVPVGSLGMWHLPDASVSGGLFAARVCDDIGGVAAALCLLDELIAAKVKGHVIALLSRAEEVGFAGVLAVAMNGWIPRRARVIGLETSKASGGGGGGAAQGDGPVVRVGDKTGIFSAGLTHFICQAAGAVWDEDGSFKWQRKLMDGGTCNSTAFSAFGYDAAGMCVGLGNYHNMTIAGEIGWGDGSKAGPGIASETIHLDDFAGMVRILVEVARRYPKYMPGFGTVRERLSKLHKAEQQELLYATSDQKAAARLRKKRR